MCEADGCAHGGEYKAPKSRDRLYDYQWLCLDHVKEYNKKWDYFAQMNVDEIESFMREAVTGHRPTWERERAVRRPGAFSAEKLQEEFLRFFGQAPRSAPRNAATGRPITPKERKALGVLGLESLGTHEELKSRYRQLVKACHPDLHSGDKQCENRFKDITAAYAYLSERLKLHEQTG